MRIAVISYGDEEVKEYREISFVNKEKYCRKHGYDFIGSDKDFKLDRHPSWSKVILMRGYLEKYDWIFWSDVDSLVMNMNIKLEQFISNRYDLIISHSTERINFGNVFLRNSQLGMKIIMDIEGIVREHANYKWKDGWEEGALIHLLGTTEYVDLLERVNIIPFATFNKFPYEYQKGDFIIHFADKWKDFNKFKEMAQ